MSWDDIVYVLLLLFCIGFGHFYREIKDPLAKQWTGTGVGFAVAFLATGSQIIHPIFVTLVNAVIVTRLSWKQCHIVSFAFTFFYLLGFFRLADWYGLSLPSGPGNMIQMMLTLKLVGLAFEINSAATAPADDPSGAKSPAFDKVGFIDVFHYGFNYAGLLTGPYYRYRTYWDSIYRPFAQIADHWGVTLGKLKEIAVYSTIYLLLGYYYPSEYFLADEFMKRSFWYRIWYIYPSFLVFKMRIYAGMALSECVCTMAGVGAYPTSCTTISGLGPKNYQAFENLSKNPEKIKAEDIDFETIHNINTWGVESCTNVRVAMKMWNTCTQYWMAAYVYKRFPHKVLRVPVTFLISALWHGYYAGYYICICSVVFYLPMDDIYVKFYKQSEENSLAKKGWGFMGWFMKTFCMSYLAASFQVLKLRDALNYYGSVYYVGQVLVAVLYVIGRILQPYILVKPKVKEG
ncbi:lysophospholipid acyltransferase 7 [Neodiprion virginianus]|uniref:lysophospholipid acyltransferase 7 n=1 Tax=Neodiprion virginianus TaxID=2961670 RepID=UPI001EE6BA0B|nr:lysophospholipid acyltransferase 7 [Neodiprion virginianus]